MIELNLVWIISIVLIVAVAVLFVVNGIAVYKHNNNEKYSFFRHFPHEISYKEDPFRKRFFVLLIIYCCMFGSILWNTLPFLGNFKSFSGLVFVEALFALLTAISFFAVNIVEAKYVRQHTAVSTLYMAGTFGMVTMTAVFSFLLFTINKSALHLCVGVVSALLVIVVIAVMLNPKLKDWAKLDSKRNDSGEVEFSRPKLFPLAYSEWITFVVSTLGLILFLIACL